MRRNVSLLLLILSLYFFNQLFFGFLRSPLGSSFESEYHLRTGHFDILKLEGNAEKFYGPPTNLLPKDFVIENDLACSSSSDPETAIHPYVLLVVKSEAGNRKRREAIRSTWGNARALEVNNLRLVFVLGKGFDVQDESSKHNDLIQINSNSHELVAMLRWVDEHCRSRSRLSPHRDLRQYVLFIDDDYFLNVANLLSYLAILDGNPELTTYERRMFVTGHRIDRSRPVRVVNDRWFISEVDYPYSFYPSYVSSECFLMTRYNTHLFYLASQYTRLVPFDQIYLGLLAYVLSVDFQPNNHLFVTSTSNDRNRSEVICRHL